MIPVKTPDELERMRVVCAMTARVRDALAEAVKPGIATKELDDLAAELIEETGGKAAFFGYRGYPGHLCVSINDEVVHGIPGDRLIQLGDMVSLDVGIEYDGFIGDTATTVMVGVTDAERIRLARTTEAALQAGLAHARAGARLSDISHAVEKVATDAGFSVVREFVGHGIGRAMHEEPQIPNFGPPGRGPELKAGMTLAIEPMVNLGTHEVVVQDDNWTVATKDGKPSAHFEHTVAVGEDGPEILTIAGK